MVHSWHDGLSLCKRRQQVRSPRPSSNNSPRCGAVNLSGSDGKGTCISVWRVVAFSDGRRYGGLKGEVLVIDDWAAVRPSTVRVHYIVDLRSVRDALTPRRLPLTVIWVIYAGSHIGGCSVDQNGLVQVGGVYSIRHVVGIATTAATEVSRRERWLR